MLGTGREQDSGDPSSGSTTIHNRGVRNRALPIAGYLYQEKVDVQDIIDPVDMGLKVLQARRKGGMAKFYSPERYQTSVKTMLDTITIKKESRSESDLQMWGDTFPTNDVVWPKIKKNGHIRCVFYNVNGISHRQNYFEMDMAMQMMSQEQADLLLISEVNLNMYKPRVRARLKESIRDFDKYAKVSMAYPPEEPFTTTDFNMGGLLAVVQGGLSGRISDQGADPIGRWCWVTLSGDKEELTVICAYKVGKHKGTPGGNSVAQQEIRAMLKRDHPQATQPRKAFDTDMADFVVEQRNKGREIILFMDANTPTNSAESNQFLAAAGLYDVASFAFPNKELPRTF